MRFSVIFGGLMSISIVAALPTTTYSSDVLRREVATESGPAAPVPHRLVARGKEGTRTKRVGFSADTRNSSGGSQRENNHEKAGQVLKNFSNMDTTRTVSNNAGTKRGSEADPIFKGANPLSLSE
ncbi:hypothetical protein C8J56DRAFT_1080054 [Mycena floridula]|nr:hypothetical protein C8J56DRAFT_1080054 [Mycena floridula]